MERFSIGDVVLVNFPFSSPKGQKIRPALVLAMVEFDNLILCQITSKPYSSKTAIRLDASNFSTGQLPITSFIRPDKLFTADQSLIAKSIGKIQTPYLKKVLSRVRKLFTLI